MQKKPAQNVHQGRPRLGAIGRYYFPGPVPMESLDICLEIGTQVKEYAQKHWFWPMCLRPLLTKANPHLRRLFQSIGFDPVFGGCYKTVGNILKVPLVTDVHEKLSSLRSCSSSGGCEFRYLPFYAGRTGTYCGAWKEQEKKSHKNQKGQFMALEDMQYAVDKIRSTGNQQVCLTERGFSLGYHNLVVDMRAFCLLLRQFAPVVLM